MECILVQIQLTDNTECEYKNYSVRHERFENITCRGTQLFAPRDNVGATTDAYFSITKRRAGSGNSYMTSETRGRRTPFVGLTPCLPRVII